MPKDDLTLPIRVDIPFQIGDWVNIAPDARSGNGLTTLGRGKSGLVRGAFTYGGEDLRVTSPEGATWIVHYSYLTRS